MTINAIDVTMATGAGGVLEQIPTGGPEVIFETTFALDGAFESVDQSLFNEVTKPNGWTACKGDRFVDDKPSLQGIPTGGVGGSVAMRLNYEANPPNVQPTIVLAKHLTDDINTGYTNVHVRYQVKFSDNFRISTSALANQNATYWKWGRLWQNTSPAPNPGNPNPGYWSENRIDSEYIVWNWGSSNPPAFEIQPGMTCQSPGAVNPGSSGGERTRSRVTQNSVDSPDLTKAFFPSMPGWELDWTGDGSQFVTTPQDWHTVEYQFQLSDGIVNGLWKMWFDGVLMDGWYDNDEQAGGSWPLGAPTPGSHNVIATLKNGSGINWLGAWDNMVEWNMRWADPGIDGWLDVNDIVVSTNRIGHTSEVAGQPGYIATDDGSTPVPIL